MDTVIVHIGELGAYQKKTFALLSVHFIMSGVYTFSVLYAVAEPRHRCQIGSSDTYDIRNEVQNKSVRASIPVDAKGQFLPCSKYVMDGGDDSNSTTASGRAVVSCEQFTYDTSEVLSSLVTEHDLVCESRTIAATITSMTFVGRLIGSLLFGILADRYGRRKTLIGSVAVMLICCGASIAPDPYVYLVFRLIGSCCTTGSFDCAYIIGIEIAGPKTRTQMATAASLAFTVGYLAITGVAYALRDWQFISIFVAAPFLIFLMIAVWCVPESPRWLLSMGNKAGAQRVLENIAEGNGKIFPKEMFDKAIDEKSMEVADNSIMKLLKNKTMLKRLLACMIVWCTVDMGYFGTSLQDQYLQGGTYFNNTLNALMDIPGIAMVFVSVRIGRKRAFLISVAIATAGMLCAGFLEMFLPASESGTGAVTATMFGKLGTSGAYNLLYVWTAEAMPTAYRNLVLGICSAASSTGSIAAPYLIQIDTDGGSASQAVPSIVFGALLAVSVLAAFVLPETSQSELPDNINEALNMATIKGSDYSVLEESGTNHNNNKN